MCRQAKGVWLNPNDRRYEVLVGLWISRSQNTLRGEGRRAEMEKDRTRELGVSGGIRDWRVVNGKDEVEGWIHKLDGWKYRWIDGTEKPLLEGHDHLLYSYGSILSRSWNKAEGLATEMLFIFFPSVLATILWHCHWPSPNESADEMPTLLKCLNYLWEFIVHVSAAALLLHQTFSVL